VQPDPALRPVAWWLVACAVMIFMMVILGGATRLTHSGLSMVEWKPLTILPPLSDAQWQAEFANYQKYPQFLKENAWMGLSDFKSIYWLEYLHRLWGRCIGVVFFVPFIVFLVQRRIDRTLALKLAGIFVLGGLQGAIGWFMVASGLADRPSVSQYRLALHLVTAFIVYGCIVWVALDMFAAASPSRPRMTDPRFCRRALTVASAVLLVVVAGALVAGLHAGLIYNTFPLMDGQVIPKGLGDLSPWYLNMFENVMTVQFDHRILAILLVIKIVGMWLRSRKAPLPPRARTLTNAVLGMAFVQAGLGISTLLLVVPTPLALAHQSGALILFTLSICLAHDLRPAPRTQTVANAPHLSTEAAA
jgi:cytochrome c oxidase assembly protein subunit 15